MYKCFFFLIALLCNIHAYSADNCFVAKEKGKIVIQNGECGTRRSPWSTFKIPIALMGFAEQILKNQNEPVIDYSRERHGTFTTDIQPKYAAMLFWPRPQTPESWMKYSVVWYSREVTELLGIDKFLSYIKKLRYGNMNIVECKDDSEGLYNAWLGQSLQISPLEQLEFIEKLGEKKLPFSNSVQENTIQLIKSEKIWENWELYGKTGSGGKDGWFIGWAQNKDRRIYMVQYLEFTSPLLSSGRIAKEMAKDNIIRVMLGAVRAADHRKSNNAN